MKFDILKRVTGEVIFSAEIECDDDTPQRVKLGLAVKVAVKARADLDDAIRLKPDFAEAHNSLSEVLRDLGQLNEAVDSYKKELKMYSNV